MSHSESARQWVHLGSGAFALLLRTLTWRQAALLAVVALAFNAIALPRLGGRRLYRPADQARGFPLGILLYPISVLLLIVFFRERLDLAAAAWAILACGDGAATLAGRALESRPLPWNPDKSVAGTTAFVVFGAAAGVSLALWTRPSISPAPTVAFAIVAPIAAAIAAGLVESIPVRLDDNLSVPFTAAAVLWLATLVDEGVWTAARTAVAAAVPVAVAVNAVVAWLGYRAKSVSVSGMIAGAVIGSIIWAAAGPSAWTLLFAAFLVATLTSRVGIARKTRLGIAEERGGRRGAGNAFANTGIAAIAAAAAVTTPYSASALVAFAAALTAGGSDTVASEIGKAWGRRTFLISTLRPVPPGTPGALSLEGTAAGLAAAFALGALAIAVRLVTPAALLPIVVGATVGAFAESALGATLEGAGILNNDMLNFINTAIAAVVAIGLA